MSVCVTLCVCVCVCVRGACVCVCEWRGEFNRVVLVVQLGLIFHFILNPKQRRVFQLVSHKSKVKQSHNTPVEAQRGEEE
jgi:multisubunit Na+/H+ antiporter MnhG subunit